MTTMAVPVENRLGWDKTKHENELRDEGQYVDSVSQYADDFGCHLMGFSLKAGLEEVLPVFSAAWILQRKRQRSY
ncbi:hypothetical protein KKI24_18795 [bacterium]|nr:hypothetical protein [bacterium]